MEECRKERNHKRTSRKAEQDMYYFIVNITSRTGKGKRVWKMLEEELEKRKVEYQAFFTKYKGHAGELAGKLTKKYQEDVISLVVVGGDGTANEVVNGIQNFEKVKLGYIPAGSGNDLARGLHLPKNPPAALQVILESTELYPMDVGKVSWGRGLEQSAYFNISSGVGMDADVCRRVNASGMKVFLNKLHLGRVSYFVQTGMTLAEMPSIQASVQFDDGEKKRIHGLICMAVMNHRYEGGGLPMAPDASDQDGKLSVCYIHGVKKLSAVMALLALVKGKHIGFRGIELSDCESCTLWLQEPVAGHTDGEDLGDPMHLRYECLPGALKIIR
ncbi:MAG: diacylglycerol kinase family lipid kinase [Lachnospiraceae bacterium]|nr:diacylglycerol kinase family lipid kinase [Lachnospiraceae bacterium]